MDCRSGNQNSGNIIIFIIIILTFYTNVILMKAIVVQEFHHFNNCYCVRLDMLEWMCWVDVVLGWMFGWILCWVRCVKLGCIQCIGLNILLY